MSRPRKLRGSGAFSILPLSVRRRGVLNDYSCIYNTMAKMTKKFPLSPLGDRVVVKPSLKEGEKKLASGIIIPETVNKEKLFSGEVIAVGPDRRGENGKRIPVEVKPGDTVYFKKPWDEPLKLNDVEYYVLSESDIILIEN